MTSETDDTREGKGRVQPGPSSSAEIRSRRQPGGTAARPGAIAWVASLVLAAATAASSVFGTQAHQYSAPGAMAFVAGLGAFAGIVAVLGMPKARPGSLGQWLPAALAGAGGFALAPWLVMANRYTDAPPGSEVFFLTTASWGAMLLLAIAVPTRERVSRVGGAVLALAGAAALVANWERPSSFSLFVRFPREELLMLVAGVLWVALVLVLLRAARRATLPVSALAAALGGVGGAVVLVLIGMAGGQLERADFAVPGLWGFGVATALAVAALMIVLRSGRVGGAAVAYLLVPAAATAVILAEQATGPLGPQPIVVGPALASIACTAAGAWIASSGSASVARVRSGGAIASVAAGAAALAAAIVALATPAMVAAVQGLRADGSQFAATFDLMGYEAAGPWLAAGLALSALGMALEGSVGWRCWPRALAFTAGLAAWYVAARTPLRTLTSFVPSDVQVDYGSEYARITFAGGVGVSAVIALAGAALAVALVWFGRAPVAEAGVAADDVSRGDRS